MTTTTQTLTEDEAVQAAAQHYGDASWLREAVQEVLRLHPDITLEDLIAEVAPLDPQ